MTKASYTTGVNAENLAEEYLVSKSYKILHRRYRAGYDEIDLIVLSEEGDIVFVEVKALLNMSFGTPSMRVTKTKQKHLIKAGLSFMQETDNPSQGYRFDVIGINLSKTPYAIDHIINAFELEEEV
jgi:putative endonuclease